MLDGHSGYVTADPIHSLALLKKIYGLCKNTVRSVLEVAAGNGRVSKAVL